MIKTNEFLRIEEKYHLYDDEIFGVNYWVYTRFWIWENFVRAQKMGIHITEKKPPIKKGEWGAVGPRLLKNYLFKGRVKHKRADVCFVAHERRNWQGKTYDCMYTEELSDIFTSNVILERPYLYDHFVPVKNKNLVYTDRASINGELAFLMTRKLKKGKYASLLETIADRVREPLCEIADAYEITIDISRIVAKIAEKILNYKGKYRYFKHVLEIVRPKLIIEVVNYAMDCMMINEIAGKMGITTIELQHGQILDWHIAYRYAGNKKIEQLPDKIYLFSDFWKHNIKLPIEEKNLISTGFPHFEKMRMRYCKERALHQKKRILFISQMEIGTAFSKIAVELSEGLNLDEYELIYKLHPSEFTTWKEKYPWLLKTEIEVIDNSQHNLYEYFASCDVQVGVCSTGIYEGLGFNLITFIYDVPLSESMNVLCQKGYAKYFKTASELESAIKSKNCTQPKMDLWKKNSLKTMVQQIKDEIRRTGRS